MSGPACACPNVSLTIGSEHLLDVHLISTSTNKNPRRYLEQTAGACEQGMERGQPVTKADVARNGL